MEKLLSTRKVAERLGVHINTVWNLIKGGKLKARKIGGNGKSRRHWRIKEVDLNDFISGRSAEAEHTESK